MAMNDIYSFSLYKFSKFFHTIRFFSTYFSIEHNNSDFRIFNFI